MSAFFSILLGMIGFFLFWRLFYFFRNPPRKIPAEESAIISPADGYICYIKEVTNNEIPISLKKGNSIPLREYGGFLEQESSDYWLIGIYMSVFDVHYNRAPIAGKIEMLERFFPSKNMSMGGLFINLILNRKPLDQDSDFMLTNERCSTWIRGRDISVGMIQIADKWISNIIPSISPGENVAKGQTVGLIRMGSQVDLLVPKTVKLNCALKQRVKAGETILASLNK